MFTLRCTAKLLARLKASPVVEMGTPTSRLGDWYAHLLFTRPTQLVLCVSERTLLSVLILACVPGAAVEYGAQGCRSKAYSGD